MTFTNVHMQMLKYLPHGIFDYQWYWHAFETGSRFNCIQIFWLPTIHQISFTMQTLKHGETWACILWGGGGILKCQHIPLEKNVSLVAKWFYLEKWIPQSFVFKFMKLFTHSVTANWYANFSRSVESGELPVCLRLYDFFVFVRKDSGLKVLFLLNLFNMVKIKEKCTHAIACIHCIIQKHI